MKKIFLFALAVSVAFGASAITPNKIVIPHIEGYKTLKGDFHIHTVFSDANVWPTTRVHEAIWEGLDVIAITDHVDTRHQKMVKNGYFTEKCDRDESYNVAKKAAGKKLLVIHGGEISRGMPPGHWNCLFVQDNDEITQAAEANDHDHFLAMKGGLAEAKKQGAFTMWNHPNWEKQAPNQTKWWKEHEKLYKAGYMNGIEIYNKYTGYSPEAHEWALKRNITMFGNSDVHNMFMYEVDYLHGDHRPVTLVFAKEKTLDGVREALDNQRTAVFAEGMVYGREQELDPLFEACVKVKSVKFTDKQVSFTLENKSNIPVKLSKAPGSEHIWYPRYITIPPKSSFVVEAKLLLVDNKQPKFDASTKEVTVNFYVDNYLVGPSKPLKFSVKATRE